MTRTKPEAPPHPKTPKQAAAWLEWASHHHQPSCQCHGCMSARRLLAEDAAAKAGAKG
jgi:hypothetical protein